MTSSPFEMTNESSLGLPRTTSTLYLPSGDVSFSVLCGSAAKDVAATREMTKIWRHRLTERTANRRPIARKSSEDGSRKLTEHQCAQKCVQLQSRILTYWKRSRHD